MWSHTPFRTPLPTLLFTTTLPSAVNGASTTTVLLTITRTVIGNATTSAPVPSQASNTTTILAPSDKCVTICPPIIPGLPSITLNATLPSSQPAPIRNTTSSFDRSAVQGHVPRNTSTTCAHSMSHFVPPTSEPSMTTVPSQESDYGDLEGQMSIQTVGLPTSNGALQTSGGGVNRDGGTAKVAEKTSAKENDVIAWSYMDPDGTRTVGKDGDKGWRRRVARWFGGR
ncbi:hypothetical protein BU23DRAFT_98660 [Bimuria novae-zelandiae CBS 107.79]|uniref:Uncharacterized protein n=1 Tax=Bimuria novae-zelandiae CBS 107.79 TaxID=1447943 RepID=A0A6A5VUT5_9PLEO|nr:hypothetical protein BU23DRAFT_98660 [Bimuria novae-zelandiae CBS 107.79]